MRVKSVPNSRVRWAGTLNDCGVGSGASGGLWGDGGDWGSVEVAGGGWSVCSNARMWASISWSDPAGGGAHLFVPPRD